MSQFVRLPYMLACASRVELDLVPSGGKAIRKVQSKNSAPVIKKRKPIDSHYVTVNGLLRDLQLHSPEQVERFRLE